MSTLKSFITIKQYTKSETIIQKSRFIGEVFPVLSESDVSKILSEVKSGFWDASHHCFAYSIGSSGEYARFSDDGEPSGTAGMPIMEAIRYAGITNTLCVVTRYFGGILLGTGGLVKAYSGSCKKTIEQAEKVLMAPATEYSFLIPYALYSLFSRVSEKYSVIDETVFEDAVRCRVHVKNDIESSFLLELTERSNGQIKGIREGEALFPFKL